MHEIAGKALWSRRTEKDPEVIQAVSAEYAAEMVANSGAEILFNLEA